MKKSVAILIFDDVEVLDFAGPFEVFGVADELSGHSAFNVFTVAPAPGTVRARNGLKVIPDFALDQCPVPAVLVVPGGAGSRALMRQPSLLEWVRTRASRAEVVLSVCTGARVLGAAGLLDGLRVTTHHEHLEELAGIAPRAIIDPSRRFHDHPPAAARGRIVTAAGVSASIDASLHVVGTLLGEDLARATARQMEYPRQTMEGEAA